MLKGTLAALSLMLGLSVSPSRLKPNDFNFAPVAAVSKSKNSKSRKHMTFKKPDRWDFRGYAGNGHGFFKSRQTGCVEVKKIHVRNPSRHVQELYELNS